MLHPVASLRLSERLIDVAPVEQYSRTKTKNGLKHIKQKNRSTSLWPISSEGLDVIIWKKKLVATIIFTSNSCIAI